MLDQTTEYSEKNAETPKVKESWKKVLETLRDKEPQLLDSEREEEAVSTEVRLFRGTQICDILYAVLENKGKLVSPLSGPDPVERHASGVPGTIITEEVGMAVSVANNQIEKSSILEKKYQWMSTVTGLPIEEVKMIRGLWQPILLEITNHIPPLWVEDHYQEIWTTHPINILKGALSVRTMNRIKEITGLDLESIQQAPTEFVSDSRIERIIAVRKTKDQRSWERAIQDSALTPEPLDLGTDGDIMDEDFRTEEYWEEERRRQLEASE